MKPILSCSVLLFCAAIAATTAPSTSPTTAPSTAPSLQSVVVRDTDARAATTQVVASGGYVSALPKNWSLQFNFAATQPSHVAFTLDGKQPHIENYLPWVCQGDNVPINLGLGDHSITWAADGQSPQAFAISVLPAAEFGENLAGLSDPAGDPSVHPQLLATAKALKLSAVRLWIEGSFTSQPPIGYFKIAKQWQAAGLKVIAVANFQNAVPRCSAPGDSVWTSYCTNFPTPDQTGIYAISLGNEINTGIYYNGTAEQLGHLMQLAYPILHAKGYVVIAGSDLDDLIYDQQLNKLGALAWCDRVDVHAYYATAAELVAFIDKGIAFGRSIHKPCDATELGVRMNPGNLPAWAVAHGQVLAQLKTRSGYFLPFSFYPMESVDQACPLDGKYEQNAAFYPAFNAALGK